MLSIKIYIILSAMDGISIGTKSVNMEYRVQDIPFKRATS